MKSGVLATLEPYFTGVLAVSFILHALFTLVISFSERSLEPPSREDVLKYMAQVQPQKIEVKVPEAKVEEKEDENEDKEGKDDKPKKVKKKEEPKKTADKSAGKPKKGKGTSDAKRAEIREKVAGQALAAIIGATGGGAGSAVGDIFKSGTSIGGDLTEAIAGTDGVGVGRRHR